MMKLNSNSNLEFKEMDSKNQNTILTDDMDMDMKLVFSESEDEEQEPVKENDLDQSVKTTNGKTNGDTDIISDTLSENDTITKKMTEIANLILDNKISTENKILNDKNDELDDISSLDDINSPEEIQNASLDDISSSDANDENKLDEDDDDLDKTQEFNEDEIKEEMNGSQETTEIAIGSASTIIKEEDQEEITENIETINEPSAEITFDLKLEEELQINADDDDLLKRLEAADTDTNTIDSIETNDLLSELLEQVDDENNTNDVQMINDTMEKANVDEDDINGDISALLKETIDEVVLLAKDPLEQTLVAMDTDDVEPPIKKHCDQDIRKSIDEIFNQDSSSAPPADEEEEEEEADSIIALTKEIDDAMDNELETVNNIRKSIEEEEETDSIMSLTKEIDDAMDTEVETVETEKSIEEESIPEATKDQTEFVPEEPKQISDESSENTQQPPIIDDDDDVCIVEKDPFDDIPSDASNSEDKAKSNKRSSQVLEESISDSSSETSKKVKLTEEETTTTPSLTSPPMSIVVEEPETDLSEKLIIDETVTELEPELLEPEIEKEAEPPGTKDDNEIKTIEIIPTCIPDVQSETEDAAKQDNNLLEPMPKTVVKRSIELYFLKKFKKDFQQMTCNDLEELVLQKVVEAIVNKSEISELRHKIESQELRIQTFQTKTAELAKQYRDLEMVHKKVLSDLEVRNSGVIMPVKITRAVGLQVCSPRHANPLPTTQTVMSTKLVKTTSTTTVQTPPHHHGKQLAMNSTPPNRGVRTVHKITPMRPPLSDQQQKHVHDQQQFQKNQLLQKQQLMAKQKMAQQKAQLQQAQLAQQQAAAKTAAAISAKMIQSQQIAQQQLLHQQQQPRIPPVIVKKTANQRFITVQSGTNTTTPTSPMVNIPSKAGTSIPKSVIDLTDEEDNRKTKPNILNGQLPSLVAFPGANKKPGFSVGQQPRSPNVQAQRMTLSKVNQTVAILPKVNSMPPRRSNTQMSRRPNGHPAPLPFSQNPTNSPAWKRIPPRPIIRINNVETGIVISWSVDDMTDEHAEIVTYQIYAYQETSSPPSTDTWRHVGDVKSMLLPMAVTLTQFQEGQRYHFAVRAVDEHSRCGMFSPARTWA